MGRRPIGGADAHLGTALRVESGDGAGERSSRGGRPLPDPADLAGRNLLATEHLSGERLHEAVTVLESLLQDCRLVLGDEHPETLVVEGNLAVAHVLSGEHEIGSRLMLDNVARRERVFGDGHALTLTARDALATTHRLAGRLAEALRLYSGIALQRNRVLGPSHPDTLTTRLGLGLTLAESGDTATALDVVTAALRDCEQAGVAGRHTEVLRSCRRDIAAAGAHDAPAAGMPGPTVIGAAVPHQRGGSAPAADDRERAADGRCRSRT